MERRPAPPVETELRFMLMTYIHEFSIKNKLSRQRWYIKQLLILKQKGSQVSSFLQDHHLSPGVSVFVNVH